MILINLLPHREARRKRRKAAFFAALGVSAVAGLLVVGVWYVVLQQLKSQQDERNAVLQREIGLLEVQIKDIANLRGEIDALKARQRAVEDLQTDRNVPVHLLNELVRQTPEGVYLTSIKQTDAVIAVNGIAQTNERVSEMLRNALYNSQWLERPELVEIKSTTLNANTREQRRLYEFAMRVSIKRPQPASAASTPAGAASRPAS